MTIIQEIAHQVDDLFDGYLPEYETITPETVGDFPEEFIASETATAIERVEAVASNAAQWRTVVKAGYKLKSESTTVEIVDRSRNPITVDRKRWYYMKNGKRVAGTYPMRRLAVAAIYEDHAAAS